jgi:5-methylcytosine-specific restriction protein A
MNRRPCMHCRRYLPDDQFKDGRCPDCRREYQRQRDARRGSSTARGYGTGWQRLAAQIIVAHPYCAQCGHTGSQANPLTVDHIVPKAKGGTDDADNLRVLCRLHNSGRPRQGRGRGSLETLPPPDPRPRFSRKTLS